MALNKVQSVVANIGAAAGTSLNIPLAATQFQSTLIAFVMCAVASAAITPPANQGWIQIQTQAPTNPAGGTLAMFILPYNPGGLTGVTFTFVSSLASAAIYEISGTPGVAQLWEASTTMFSNNNAASWGVGGKATTQLGDMAIGCVGYVNNTALTASGYPVGFAEDANTISTNAAGNAGIRVCSNLLVGVANVNFGGLSLSGTPSNGPNTAFILILQSAPEPQTGGPYPYLG